MNMEKTKNNRFLFMTGLVLISKIFKIVRLQFIGTKFQVEDNLRFTDLQFTIEFIVPTTQSRNYSITHSLIS